MIETVFTVYAETLFASPFFYSVYFSFVAGSGFVVAGMRENYFPAVLFLLLLAFLFEAFTAEIHALESVYLLPVYAVSFLFGFSRKRGSLSFLDWYTIGAPFRLIGSWFKRLFAGVQLKGTQKKTEHSQWKSEEREQGRASRESPDNTDQQRRQRASEGFRRNRQERVEKDRDETTEDIQSEKNTVDTRSPLDIMGLNEGYTENDLKRRYRKLSEKYHPDKNQHMSDIVRKEMEQEMVKVNLAYESLKGA